MRRVYIDHWKAMYEYEKDEPVFEEMRVIGHADTLWKTGIDLLWPPHIDVYRMEDSHASGDTVVATYRIKNETTRNMEE